MKIGTKALLIILAVTMLSLGSVYLSAFRNIRSMRDDIIHTIDDSTGKTVADLSANQKETLKTQLLRIAGGNANFLDEILGEWRRDTQIFADFATGIYSNPEEYSPRAVSPPRRGNKELAAQLLFSRGNLNREALAEEIGRAANVLDYLLPLMRNSSLIEYSTFASESGFLFDVDILSDHKFSGPDTAEPKLFFAQTRPWYRLAKEKNAFHFTEPFRDFFTDVPLISGAAPVFRNGKFIGVAGLSFKLTELQEQIARTGIGATGYGFIFTNQGKVFISPKDSGDLAVDANLLEGENRELAAAVAKILAANDAGVIDTTVDGREIYFSHHPLASLDWHFGAVIDREEMDVVIRNLEDKLNRLTDETGSTIGDKIRRFTLTFLGLTGLGFVLALFASRLAVRWFIKPIRKMTESVQRIGRGDLDVVLPVGANDELGLLADNFNRMTANLKTHMRDLALATAEKERISTELEVARQIQTNMLPSAFPPLRGIDAGTPYDIYATMKPAKEVGGDLYDFFAIDENRLGLVIADACGKGVPAAMFIVIVKTLVKNHAQNGRPPAEVFELVNNQLCEENEGSMFATALFAVFDFKTMDLTIVNAGHPSPFVRQKGGAFEPVPLSPRLPLGGLEGVDYEQRTVNLEGGATVFFYTDGVTEAQDKEDRLFSDEALLSLLRDKVPENAFPKDIVSLVDREVSTFIAGREAYDDMTMLVFTVVPKDKNSRSPDGRTAAGEELSEDLKS